MEDCPGTKPYFTNKEFVRREKNVMEDGAARGYHRGHEGNQMGVDDDEPGTAMPVMLMTSRLEEIDQNSLLDTVPGKVEVHLHVLS